ncbi:MAG: DNA-J related domain-containing protein [Cellvibrionaceae bacterium]
MDNPFKNPITDMLGEAGPWSEHQILSQLVADGLLNRDYGRDSLALFQAHFLTMNALYSIQTAHFSQGRYLKISALRIEWLGVSQGSSMSLTQGEENLREYYSDWDNFARASAESVEDLLDGFWRRFLSQDDKHAALEALKLEEPVEFSEVKKRYRQLAMEHHPDRGGSAAELATINDAYATLKRCYAVS